MNKYHKQILTGPAFKVNIESTEQRQRILSTFVIVLIQKLQEIVMITICILDKSLILRNIFHVWLYIRPGYWLARPGYLLVLFLKEKLDLNWIVAHLELKYTTIDYDIYSTVLNLKIHHKNMVKYRIWVCFPSLFLLIKIKMRICT